MSTTYYVVDWTKPAALALPKESALSCLVGCTMTRWLLQERALARLIAEHGLTDEYVDLCRASNPNPLLEDEAAAWGVLVKLVKWMDSRGSEAVAIWHDDGFDYQLQLRGLAGPDVDDPEWVDEE